MGELARSVAILVLVVGAYFYGRTDGRELRDQLAIAESAILRADLEAASGKLLESERRIEALEATAAQAGTRTRTVIRQATDLAAVPVPAAVSAGLQAQMARTTRFGIYRGDEGGSDAGGR